MFAAPYFTKIIPENCIGCQLVLLDITNYTKICLSLTYISLTFSSTMIPFASGKV